MSRRGIVMVRGQYAKNKKTRRRNMRTKTPTDLLGLRDYFDDTDHTNHEGVRILPCKPWRTTLESFVAQVAMAARAYQNQAAGRSGGKWNGDIAEHLIAAPDEGSDLSEAEVERLATRILEKISPRSPAIWAAHFDEESKTWEIHFAISSFTSEPTPHLRVTDLRRREGADYVLLLDESGFVGLTELNQQRRMAGLSPIRSLRDIHRAKIASVVDVLSRHDEISGRTLSIQELLSLFQGSSWSPLKHTKASVSLDSEDFSTPLHVRWETLRKAVSKRAREKSRRVGKGRDSGITPYERD